MSIIKGYHAHLYYDQDTYDQAKQLSEEANEKFPLDLGRMHEKPVGPHPMWSRQLAFKCELFGEIIPWLTLNRNGLTIFIHADTGDNLTDHTDYAMWMGSMEKLDLSIF